MSDVRPAAESCVMGYLHERRARRIAATSGPANMFYLLTVLGEDERCTERSGLRPRRARQSSGDEHMQPSP